VISIRKMPFGATTSASISPIVPSRMNSKFAHAAYGSWSGSRSIMNTSASRSHGNSEGVTCVQRAFTGNR
jgi:hypothetical protein